METDAHSDKLTDLEDEGERTEKEDEEIVQANPETPRTMQRTELTRTKKPLQTISSPSLSRKESRAEEEDVEMEDVASEPSPVHEEAQEPVVEEVVVRRKRLRA